MIETEKGKTNILIVEKPTLDTDYNVASAKVEDNYEHTRENPAKIYTSEVVNILEISPVIIRKVL